MCETTFGPVTKAVIKYTQAGRSRGFGFVTFETTEATRAACSQHYTMLDDKRVELKIHEECDDDCARLRAAVVRRFEQSGAAWLSCGGVEALFA